MVFKRRGRVKLPTMLRHQEPLVGGLLLATATNLVVAETSAIQLPCSRHQLFDATSCLLACHSFQDLLAQRRKTRRDHRESICPRCPICGWGHPGCRSQTEASEAHWQCCETSCHVLLLHASGEPPQHCLSSCPHSSVVTVRVRGRLCRRHGPQKMVATRSSALQQDLPCTLHIGDPPESFPQFRLFLHTHSGELFDENVTPHWRAENLDALSIPALVFLRPC